MSFALTDLAPQLPDSFDGFVPGEGAAFLLLTSAHAPEAIRNKSLLKLHEPATVHEPGHLLSEAPYTAEALASAFQQAMATTDAPINTLAAKNYAMGLKGRDKEANLIRDANVACVAGRLLLGDLSSWEEFLEPDLVNYSELPRKQLKSGKYDIQTNLQQRIDNFCKSNFPKMTCSKFVMLFEELKAHRRLEIPYLEFCKKYSPVHNFHKKGFPAYSTVCISLWGLQYRFPEHDFSNDLVISLNQLIEAEVELDSYRNAEHEKLKNAKDYISNLIRKSESSKRQVMQASFSILECYLNGIAWEFHNNEGQTLSKGKTKLLKDISNVTLRDKIRKYPLTIFGKELDEKTYKFILDEAKQYRDSLMHPSPFSAPKKFGGYDKLEKLYNIDMEIIVKTVFGVIEIVEEIETMKGKNTPEPIWLPEVKSAANHALHPTKNRDAVLVG